MKIRTLILFFAAAFLAAAIAEAADKQQIRQKKQDGSCQEAVLKANDADGDGEPDKDQVRDRKKECAEDGKQNGNQIRRQKQDRTSQSDDELKANDADGDGEPDQDRDRIREQKKDCDPTCDKPQDRIREQKRDGSCQDDVDFDTFMKSLFGDIDEPVQKQDRTQARKKVQLQTQIYSKTQEQVREQKQDGSCTETMLKAGDADGDGLPDQDRQQLRIRKKELAQEAIQLKKQDRIRTLKRLQANQAE